ncbi:MAG: alpha/beta hydrolase [Pseudomonadota bacterium]
MHKLASLRFTGIFLLLCSELFAANDTISITSNDGVIVVADTYIINLDANTPIILLFHQAGWSRGEYIEIAPKLNALGFNAIAVDLRSGNKINSVVNQTAKSARKEKLQTRYIDALPDIISTLEFITSKFPENKIIAWGSSYSAALVLHVAGESDDLIDGVLAFAPGEYFSKQGKSATWIKDSASKIKIPVFITSARNEKSNWSAIFDAISTQDKSAFIPDTKGNHGSRALWEEFDDHEVYWNAVTEFLEQHFLN